MNKATVNEMLNLAKKSGICQIYYAGTNSGGLYSSRSPVITLYLTRYPTEFTEMHGKHLKLDKYLDKVTVHDGFIEVNIGTLHKVDDDSDKVVEHYTYGDGWGKYEHYFCRLSKTILIPFENILSIAYGKDIE